MANLPEQDIWEEGIYQLEEDDLIQGGSDGTANVQAKQLANRTLYLKNKYNRTLNRINVLKEILNEFVQEDLVLKSSSGNITRKFITKYPWLSFTPREYPFTLQFKQEGVIPDTDPSFKYVKVKDNEIVDSGIVEFVNHGFSISFNVGETLFLSANGTNDTISTTLDGLGIVTYYKFDSTRECECHGNIMSLLDETCQRTDVPQFCFYHLFDFSHICSLPDLPATTLGKSCYEGIFQNCQYIKVSEQQSDVYTKPFRIPTSGNGVSGVDSLKDMLVGTRGTFTGTPDINTTYYLAEE